MKRILRAMLNYLIFFMLSAFLATCCVSLFAATLMDSLGVTLTSENVNVAAKLTFANVLALSLLFTLFDALRRKLTVERTTRRIAAAAKRIAAGDYSVRVQPAGFLSIDDNFSVIADCFNRMAHELSGVEMLRADFISNVSHEMKTPLTVMHNYGTLLQTPGLTEEKRIVYAKCITDGSRSLADMMTNILRLNKLENQQIYPNVEQYDLGEQLCEALLQYENVWEREEIEIETDIEENVIVQADKELLNIVWNNLLSNAFKFTPRGGRITLVLTATRERAVVTISDTGCGMTAQTGAHIFEKFYQADTSRATKGNGLGLALVKRIIDIIHGEISVKSAPGEGTAFTVSLRRNA